MKKLLLIGVAFSALTAGPVMAADLPVKAPTVVPVESWSWTGFYVGAHVGSLWGTKDFTIFDGTTINNSQTQISGFLGGGQIGYNYQAGRWVLGLEGQGSWLGATGANLCNVVGINNCNVRASWLATAAVRVGWTVEHALVFVKGGGAWVHENYWTNIEGTLGTTATASETRGGWMFGTGIEYALTANWSAKVEYDYLDFGSRNLAFTNALPASITAPVGIKEHASLVEFGVNYRF